MKKKYRDITVGGKRYLWKVETNCDPYVGGLFLTIKTEGHKIIYTTKEYSGEGYKDDGSRVEQITPKYVREKIVKVLR